MQHNNKYILLYSSIMVIVIALALTIVSVQLKPAQENNIRVEKMQNILKAVNIETTPGNAEEMYNKYITKTLVVNNKGEVKTGIDAFKDVDLYYELKKPSAERSLPIYICTKTPNDSLYILALRGKGLWGPIWGYIALRNDFKTVVGTMFDHKGETPGLGAEINTSIFQDQFVNKQIFDDKGMFTSVQIIKGGVPETNAHGVDAISGGTITSKGVEAMLFDCLKEYEAYFKKNQKK